MLPKTDEHGIPRMAYFVMGPESCGNRMMTRAINSAYDFGIGGQVEGTNKYVFKTLWMKDKDFRKSLAEAPNRIVFVRSIPRGSWPKKQWPPIAKYCIAFEEFNYDVYAIVMERKERFVIKSQVAHKHVPDEEKAKKMIAKSRRYINNQLKKAGVPTYIIQYEKFVTDKNFREHFFVEVLKLNSPPKMKFYNANDKYNIGQLRPCYVTQSFTPRMRFSMPSVLNRLVI